MTDDDVTRMGKIMGEQIGRVADGMTDAMVAFGILVCATTRTKPQDFVGKLDKLANDMNGISKPYSADILRGVAERLRDTVK